MSAMLGSSRRDSRPRVYSQDGEIVLVDSPNRTLWAWVTRLLSRLELLFSPPGSRL
jgi:hypothetical protein